MKRISMIVVLFLLATLFTSFTATAATTYQTTDSLNLRTGPGTSYKVVTVIPKGKTVTFLSEKNGWYQVSYKSGKTYKGYVNKKYVKKPTAKKKPFYKDGILVVNKTYSLPADYAPGESKEARDAFNKMKAAAKKEGLSISAISTYRSYDYQKQLYNNYVKKYGQKEADRFSAKPGHSEHQTGLAFDIGGAAQSHWLEQSFGNTKEGKWVAKNAHKYGFILRYPEGKEKITGYMYEPWHFRYLGKTNAKKVYDSGKTLEEYLKLK